MSKKEKVEEKVKEKVLQKVEESKTAAETISSEPPKEEGSFKIKKVTKPKQLGEEKIPDLIKVDLTKPKEETKDAIRVGETKAVDVGEQTGDSETMDVEGNESSEKSLPTSEIKEEEEEIKGK